jgi:glycosyltransferase involved in cell wall biosynthesis
MMKKIKIIHVTPRFYGNECSIAGGPKYLLYICRALQKGAESLGWNIETSVLSFGKEANVFESGPHRILHKIIKGDPKHPLTISADDIINSLQDADVVHVHQFLSHACLYVAAHARLLGKCIIGTDHQGEEHHLSYNPEVSGIFDFFHSISDFALNTYKRLKGPVKLIKGPLDTETYKPDLQKQRNPRSVLAVGRLLPHKGYEKIIEALPMEMELTIAGALVDVAYREFLFSRIQQKKVKIIEGLSDSEIINLMHTAGIFVHAATYIDFRGKIHTKPEMLGLAPLEALSTGLTTIVSDAGALPELGKLPGCYVFKSVQDLNRLLNAHLDGGLKHPAPEIIHAGVEEVYGLENFGRKMLTELQECLL